MADQQSAQVIEGNNVTYVLDRDSTEPTEMKGVIIPKHADHRVAYYITNDPPEKLKDLQQKAPTTAQYGTTNIPGTGKKYVILRYLSDDGERAVMPALRDLVAYHGTSLTAPPLAQKVERAEFSDDIKGVYQVGEPVKESAPAQEIPSERRLKLAIERGCCDVAESVMRHVADKLRQQQKKPCPD